MPYTIAIRREDLSKKGEERVAIAPDFVKTIRSAGHNCLVQPAQHPETGERKRRFTDLDYEAAGATVTEDISNADLIFGLKEVEVDHILLSKPYFMFSHTHKGQIKNRKLLKALVDKQCTLIDYELITHQNGPRVVTAFTYFAGYAGMGDSLWALSKRCDILPKHGLKQSADYPKLQDLHADLKALAAKIKTQSTNPNHPPLIVAFLGNGKTSAGAQEVFANLPVQEITLDALEETYRNGARNVVYKLVLDIPQLYRFKPEHRAAQSGLDNQETFALYLKSPELFESNMDQIFPYCTIWMNCILWSEKYPRLITREEAKHWYTAHQTLQVIGDITCDPDGAIQFSKETWIDNPVYIYTPKTNESHDGFTGKGIAVMAVTNLPCEFPLDASQQFSDDFAPLVMPLLQSDWGAETLAQANLPPEISGACILWKGEFTPPYRYMVKYL